jgi:hypothetical protein
MILFRAVPEILSWTILWRKIVIVRVEIPFELEKSFFMLFGKELHPVLVSLFQSLPATASYNISANCVGAN